MAALLAYLPQHEGLLPKWLFLIGVTAVGNIIQAYKTLTFTSQVYLGPPNGPHPPGSAFPSQTTPLHSRTFGTWTVLQGLVRLYAAYNVQDRNLYQLAMLTNIVAMWHFGSEWLYFGTTRWNKGLAGPVFVSIGTTLWMALQYGAYVES